MAVVSGFNVSLWPTLLDMRDVLEFYHKAKKKKKSSPNAAFSSSFLRRVSDYVLYVCKCDYCERLTILFLSQLLGLSQSLDKAKTHKRPLSVSLSTWLCLVKVCRATRRNLHACTQRAKLRMKIKPLPALMNLPLTTDRVHFFTERRMTERKQ